MEVIKAVNSVTNLNSYLSLTQDLLSKHKNVVYSFNLSTVLALKKIRSLEVEYFSKFQETGAAFIILSTRLSYPQSKPWPLLFAEISNLLRYWLDALRKHLISHCPGWWTFCKALLGFITDLNKKQQSISDGLLKQLAECLLDLAASDQITLTQQSEVVLCVNGICSQASREVRFSLLEACQPYLVKISRALASCGHVPSQIDLLELLMRWLPNRRDRRSRLAAAGTWLPRDLYTETTVAAFVDRSFDNFYKDAREFLNIHNAARGDVVSVPCRKMILGSLEFISTTDKWESWVDISRCCSSVAVLLEPRRLQALGLPPGGRDHLTVPARTVLTATLTRDPTQVVIALSTQELAEVKNADTRRLVEKAGTDVTLWISTRCDLEAVDTAMCDVFGDKYKKIDKGDGTGRLSSPADFSKHNGSEEDTRFSHPCEVNKPRRSGYVVNTKRGAGWKSPSTTSTTSLAHLQEKLLAFPGLRYDKEPIGVCLAPDLSCVTETSEPEEGFSNPSTGKSRPYGVCTRRRKPKPAKTSPGDIDDEIYIKGSNYISPVEDLDRGKSPNCLLSATIGAYETSIINDTLDKDVLDVSVVDLLVQEAFNTKATKEKEAIVDSGINVSGYTKKSQINAKQINKTSCTVLSSSEEVAEIQDVANECNPYYNKNNVDNSNVLKSTTTDESNTEAINDTPLVYVNTRNKNLRSKRNASKITAEEPRNFKNIGQSDVLNRTVNEKHEEIKQYSANEVEDFFNSHIQENKSGDLVLSPTLAKKINISSSDSDSFDQYLIGNDIEHVDDEIQPAAEIEALQTEVNPDDVFGCLNDIIDKVCQDLDKCTELMTMEAKTVTTRMNLRGKNVPENDSDDIIPETVATASGPQNKNVLKLTFKNTKSKKTPIKRNLRKKAKNEITKENAITEAPDNNNQSPIKSVADNKPSTPEPDKNIEKSSDKALIRRKRKLYSPKDADKQTGIHIPETEDDTSHSAEPRSKLYTPKTTATSYKDLERDRLKSARHTRRRGRVSKSPIVSPRSLKNNEMFDNLRVNLEDVGIRLVDKKSSKNNMEVYNFTSDSDDEDFKAKKLESVTVKKTPVKRAYNKKTPSKSENIENKFESTKKTKTVVKRNTKKNKKQTKSKAIINIEPARDLIDERMRESKEQDLNTSFIVEDNKVTNTPDSDLEPLSKLVRKMEPIPEASNEDEIVVEEVEEPKKPVKKRIERRLSLKKDKNSQNKLNLMPNNKEDESPLPALIIERINIEDNDGVSTTSSNLIKKCEKVIKYGEDVDTTQNLLSENERANYDSEANDIPVELAILEKRHPSDRENFCAEKYKTCSQNRVKDYNKDKDNNINIKEKRKTAKRNYKTVANKRQRKPSIISVGDNYNTSIYSNKEQLEEGSINTVGGSPITAHGTLDEEPPNFEMLKENCAPRDIELVNLSGSLKEVFIRLRNEVDFDSHEAPKAKESKITKRNKTKVDTKKSTVLERFNSKKSKKTVEVTSEIETEDELVSPKPNPRIDLITSPTISLTRLSIDDIGKWMPSPRSTSIESEKTPNVPLLRVPKTTPVVTITTRSTVKSYTNKDFNKENAANNVNYDPEIETTTSKTKNEKHQPIRKSIISPIKDFDEILTEDNTDANTSFDKLYSKLRKEPSRSNIEVIKSPATRSTLRQYLKTYTTETLPEIVPSKNNSQSAEIASEDTEIVSIGSPVVSRERVKRKAVVTVGDNERKRQRVEMIVGDIGGSMRDWFNYDLASHSGASEPPAWRDNVESVLEKLDTTLIEIHRNTSKKFVDLFFEMEKRQKGIENEMDVLYKKMFEEYREKCATIQSSHNAWLINSAGELIREDCRMKRSMVSLLREDVVATLQRMEPSRKTL